MKSVSMRERGVGDEIATLGMMAVTWSRWSKVEGRATGEVFQRIDMGGIWGAVWETGDGPTRIQQSGLYQDVRG